MLAESPSPQDILASKAWLTRRLSEYPEGYSAAGTLEILEDLLSSLTKTSAALMTGAGVEPQLFVPDSLMDAQEAAALLRVASGWSSFVDALGRELVSRFGLNANFEAMLAQQGAQAADAIADHLVPACGNLCLHLPPETLAHMAGLLLDRWQVQPCIAPAPQCMTCHGLSGLSDGPRPRSTVIQVPKSWVGC